MFCLVQDDDCHWYIIPVDKAAEFYNWCDDEDNWDTPDYATEVGGNPQRVVFNMWRMYEG